MTTKDYIGDAYYARQLARIIREYWLERGYVVNVYVEKQEHAGMRKPIYVVRSNIKFRDPE